MNTSPFFSRGELLSQCRRVLRGVVTILGFAAATNVLKAADDIVISNLASGEESVLHLKLIDAETELLRFGPKERRVVFRSPTMRVQYFDGISNDGKNIWRELPREDAREYEFFQSLRPRKNANWVCRAFQQPRRINSIGMTLAHIPAGRFQMGSRIPASRVARLYTNRIDREDAASFQDEHPRHEVNISRPFLMSTHEVTNGQFQSFADASGYATDAERDGLGAGSSNPNTGIPDEPTAKTTWRTLMEHFSRDNQDSVVADLPVVAVSWNDAQAFCQWLSEQENKTYRLPTEAEWEYACRAGSDSIHWSGDPVSSLFRVANVLDKSRVRRHGQEHASLTTDDGYCCVAPVCSFRPNRFGLFDMHGNVWEWCRDSYDADYYRRSPKTDPYCQRVTRSRVMRGGCYL